MLKKEMPFDTHLRTLRPLPLQEYPKTSNKNKHLFGFNQVLLSKSTVSHAIDVTTKVIDKAVILFC